jgi:hypothetical protein
LTEEELEPPPQPRVNASNPAVRNPTSILLRRRGTPRRSIPGTTVKKASNSSLRCCDAAEAAKALMARVADWLVLVLSTTTEAGEIEQDIFEVAVEGTAHERVTVPENPFT